MDFFFDQSILVISMTVLVFKFDSSGYDIDIVSWTLAKISIQKKTTLFLTPFALLLFFLQEKKSNKNMLNRYHSQFYVNGSVCDLSGKPRRSEVRVSAFGSNINKDEDNNDNNDNNSNSNDNDNNNNDDDQMMMIITIRIIRIRMIIRMIITIMITIIMITIIMMIIIIIIILIIILIIMMMMMIIIIIIIVIMIIIMIIVVLFIIL